MKYNPHGCLCMCDSCYSNKKEMLNKIRKIQEFVEKATTEDLADRYNKCMEIHADGIKEIKCECCSEPCGNECCCMKENQ